MVTPDKIKKTLEKGVDNCINAENCRENCPYEKVCSGICSAFMVDLPRALIEDALGYIQQLEAENERLQRYYEAEADRAADAHHNMLEAEASVSRWISVEERLPEHWHMDDKDRTLINYLVYSPDYGVDVGNYIKSAKRWVCMGLPMNVTHWMPLPEPPEVTKP